MPDVWISYAAGPREALDLLLTPHFRHRPGEIAVQLRARLKGRAKAGVVYSQTSVVAELKFEEMIEGVLPLSAWWQDFWKQFAGLWEGSKAEVKPEPADVVSAIVREYERYLGTASQFESVLKSNPSGGSPGGGSPLDGSMLPLRIIHSIAWAAKVPKSKAPKPSDTEGVDFPEAGELLEHVGILEQLLLRAEPRDKDKNLLYSVNRNRTVKLAIHRSVPAIKADAVARVFGVSCKDITWAVLDAGIDATHPAFIDREAMARNGVTDPDYKGDDWGNYSRIVDTYDFTIVRKILSPDSRDWKKLPEKVLQKVSKAQVAELRRHLLLGREIDWSLLLPFLKVNHDGDYRSSYKPTSDHGTHVAGILGADWRKEDKRPPERHDIVTGVCPDIKIIDLRVFDGTGKDTEFAVMAAMQFLRHQNAHKDVQYVHGANLSLSLLHDVSNYACGRTPVCEECQRMVSAGIVVVAAAGNDGYLRYETAKGPKDGYFNVSISDPGNAESVITVGSTHRFQPHTYGVSFFSSRGPTGDGRVKPDIVAPGEKISSTVATSHEKLVAMDGTSMAAPHVSGAAALLIARFREFAGEPEKVKKILCSTATDLGRERYFQGHGMLDVLRAMQSV